MAVEKSRSPTIVPVLLHNQIYFFRVIIARYELLANMADNKTLPFHVNPLKVLDDSKGDKPSVYFSYYFVGKR